MLESDVVDDLSQIEVPRRPPLGELHATALRRRRRRRIGAGTALAASAALAVFSLAQVPEDSQEVETAAPPPAATEEQLLLPDGTALSIALPTTDTGDGLNIQSVINLYVDDPTLGGPAEMPTSFAPWDRATADLPPNAVSVGENAVWLPDGGHSASGGALVLHSGGWEATAVLPTGVDVAAVRTVAASVELDGDGPMPVLRSIEPAVRVEDVDSSRVGPALLINASGWMLQISHHICDPAPVPTDPAANVSSACRADDQLLLTAWAPDEQQRAELLASPITLL